MHDSHDPPHPTQPCAHASTHATRAADIYVTGRGAAHIRRDDTFILLAGGACKRIQQILDGLDSNGYALPSSYVIVGTGSLACSFGGCW